MSKLAARRVAASRSARVLARWASSLSMTEWKPSTAAMCVSATADAMTAAEAAIESSNLTELNAEFAVSARLVSFSRDGQQTPRRG